MEPGAVRVLSICVPNEPQMAVVAVAVNATGDLVDSVELPTEQDRAEKALAEFMFRHAPDVSIVNAGRGRRSEFMVERVKTAWKRVRLTLACVCLCGCA